MITAAKGQRSCRKKAKVTAIRITPSSSPDTLSCFRRRSLITFPLLIPLPKENAQLKLVCRSKVTWNSTGCHKMRALSGAQDDKNINLTASSPLLVPPTLVRLTTQRRRVNTRWSTAKNAPVSKTKSIPQPKRDTVWYEKSTRGAVQMCTAPKLTCTFHTWGGNHLGRHCSGTRREWILLLRSSHCPRSSPHQANAGRSVLHEV